MQYIALYNPYAANGKGIEGAERLRLFYAEKNLSFVSMTAVDYPTFFKELGEDERVIVCGGDGTHTQPCLLTNGKTLLIKSRRLQ